MISNKALNKRQIKVKIDPSITHTSPFAPPHRPFKELILFSVSSEAFPHFSPDDLTILGGSRAVNALAGQNLFSFIHLSEKDIEFLFSLIYKNENSTALFPSGDKTLLISFQLLRAGGTGIAVTIDCPPTGISALATSELADSLDGLVLSPSVEDFQPDDEQCMELYRSVSRLLNLISGKKTLLETVRSVAELSSVKVGADLPTDVDYDQGFDSSAAISLLLCLFSHALSVGIDELKLSVSSEHDFSLSVDFETVCPISHLLLYCEKIAENMGIFFRLHVNENKHRAILVPIRRLPADGFKSGIFINGKRFFNPFV